MYIVLSLSLYVPYSKSGGDWSTVYLLLKSSGRHNCTGPIWSIIGRVQIPASSSRPANANYLLLRVPVTPPFLGTTHPINSHLAHLACIASPLFLLVNASKKLVGEDDLKGCE